MEKGQNKKKINIVIDTNIFVNPDALKFFGKNSLDAFKTFIEKIKKNKNIVPYIPTSIYQEMSYFINDSLLTKNIKSLIKKTPSRYESNIPSLLLYEFIEETRSRINKGLRIAEKYLRKGIKERNESILIKNLRNEFREAMRDGIIDSVEDFDLILLSREISGYLCTSDKGLIKWAEKLGVTCLTPEELNNLLSE